MTQARNEAIENLDKTIAEIEKKLEGKLTVLQERLQESSLSDPQKEELTAHKRTLGNIKAELAAQKLTLDEIKHSFIQASKAKQSGIKVVHQTEAFKSHLESMSAALQRINTNVSNALTDFAPAPASQHAPSPTTSNPSESSPVPNRSSMDGGEALEDEETPGGDDDLPSTQQEAVAPEEAMKMAEEAMKMAEEAANKKSEEEAKNKAEAEAKNKAEAEAKNKAEAEAEAKNKAEAEAKNKAEAEAKNKAEAEAKNKPEAEAKNKAEAEAKNKAEAEAKNKAEAEAKNKAEAEAKNKAEAEAEAKKLEEEARIKKTTEKPAPLRQRDVAEMIQALGKKTTELQRHRVEAEAIAGRDVLAQNPGESRAAYLQRTLEGLQLDQQVSTELQQAAQAEVNQTEVVRLAIEKENTAVEQLKTVLTEQQEAETKKTESENQLKTLRAQPLPPADPERAAHTAAITQAESEVRKAETELKRVQDQRDPAEKALTEKTAVREQAEATLKICQDARRNEAINTLASTQRQIKEAREVSQQQARTQLQTNRRHQLVNAGHQTLEVIGRKFVEKELRGIIQSRITSWDEKVTFGIHSLTHHPDEKNLIEQIEKKSHETQVTLAAFIHTSKERLRTENPLPREKAQILNDIAKCEEHQRKLEGIQTKIQQYRQQVAPSRIAYLGDRDISDRDLVKNTKDEAATAVQAFLQNGPTQAAVGGLMQQPKIQTSERFDQGDVKKARWVPDTIQNTQPHVAQLSAGEKDIRTATIEHYDNANNAYSQEFHFEQPNGLDKLSSVNRENGLPGTPIMEWANRRILTMWAATNNHDDPIMIHSRTLPKDCIEALVLVCRAKGLEPVLPKGYTLDTLDINPSKIKKTADLMDKGSLGAPAGLFIGESKKMSEDLPCPRPRP